MATIEVSTWAELKTALQNNPENTIKLTADIDMNEVAPTGDSIAMSYGSSSILDGNGHTIKNLRTKISSPAPIFGTSFAGTGRSFTIKNLNFVNLILAGASLVGATASNMQPPTTTVFENVGIVGSRSGAAYLFSYNGGITMNRCTIELPWKGSGSNLAYTSLVPKTLNESPSITALANYCRFVESHGGWTVPETLYYNTVDSAFLGCSYFKLSGCRIEGSVKLPFGNTRYYPYINNPYVCKYTPSSQNVCDLDWKGTVTNTYNEVYYQNFSGVMKKSFLKANGTEITISTDGGTSGYPKPIIATAAQMKDASWLSGQGFDIVVPSE